MPCRGVFFAITPEQAAEFQKSAGDDDHLMELVEAIEKDWDEAHLAECDKAWDAMHRALTDGELQYGNGAYPLNHCVLSPRQLYRGDDYIVSLVTPEEVRDVAPALQELTKEWFDGRYRTVVPADYAREYGDDDREYTWSWFEAVRDLYSAAAREGRAVVFTVDQ